MLKRLILPTAILLTVIMAPADAAKTLTDAQIKQKIIQASLANYPGPCPCPYNTARNGSHCGGRSAYSKPGGYNPICYPSDVTSDMVKKYRQSH